MHESTCVVQGFEPEATAAASEATAATSEVPVASSGVREEDYPSEYGRPHAAIGFSLVIWYGMKEDGLLWVWVVEKMDELGDRTP